MVTDHSLGAEEQKKEEPMLRTISTVSLENGRIASAELVPAGEYVYEDPKTKEKKEYKDYPAFYRVRYDLMPTEASYIRCELWLPEKEKWTGRLYGTGNGGGAGSLLISSFPYRVKTGSAAVTTDMGTSRGAFNKPEVWKDFGYRSTHLMTVSAKEIIAAVFGRKPDYSYFFGGSTGGGQGLHEAQRFPEDYDGISVSVPVVSRTQIYANFLWGKQVTHRQDGSPLFTPQQFKTVAEAGIEYFRNRTEPYAAGILIPDSRYSEENVEGIIRLARQMDSTLTEEHATALRKIYSGPSIAGKRICGGAPFGVDLTGFSRRHLWFMEWYFGKGFDPLKLDFERDFRAFEAAMGPLADADNPDLDAFRKRGGKLLLCTGTEDELIPFHMSMAYYEQVIKRCGSLAATREFCRYIILPGRMHNGARAERGVTGCRGFSIEQWREENIVPDSVTGVCRNGETIPIYFYPQMTAGDFPDNFHPVERERGTGYEGR